uniref:Immunoglobulin V-set domain-containing protein n=1 Tax=Cyprinus carpio TaxID=7962 RepID=A0A8C1UCQ7_CYPCA
LILNEERVVTVSISNVSVRDAGVYWCGAETRDTYLTFISLNTKIQRKITLKTLNIRQEKEEEQYNSELHCVCLYIYCADKMFSH